MRPVRAHHTVDEEPAHHGGQVLRVRVRLAAELRADAFDRIMRTSTIDAGVVLQLIELGLRNFVTAAYCEQAFDAVVDAHGQNGKARPQSGRDESC